MKILVTGYHGFVGLNLVPFLEANGHTVVGIGRSSGLTWDDLENDRIPVVDAIIHLAGKAHDTKNSTEADVYFKVNRDLTIKTFQYFKQHQNIKTFIFFSSVKAVADKVVGDRLTEDATYCPRGPYGESKADAEKAIVKDLDKIGTERRVYILRPCMMHGPGNKGNLNLLYRVVRLNIPWPLGDFENHRSFASIDNVCYLLGKLLQVSPQSGIYNMADDEVLSTNELISCICEALGKRAVIWNIPATLISLVARIGDRLHLPLNTERLGKLTENYVVDNGKIKQALHLNALPMSTREGLKRTIRSFQKKQNQCYETD